MLLATATANLTRPAGELEASRRAEIIADLNTSLAYLIDIQVAGKQAHWNIHGPNFAGIHPMLDLVVDDVRMYSDTVAERILALRGTAHGTITDVAAVKDIKPFPTDMQDWEGLLMAMHERLMKTSERMRNAAAGFDDELGTQDVYVEVIRGLDKWAWMLEAHLPGMKSAGARG
jgi:starvation-inducible DNA-binding protein